MSRLHPFFALFLQTRVLKSIVVLLAMSAIPVSAHAAESKLIRFNDLTHSEFLAMALHYGAELKTLEDQFPLDASVSPFEARRNRSEKINEVIDLANKEAERFSTSGMVLDSYVLFHEYDFDKKTYRLCLPQALYFENGHPKEGDPYLNAPSIRFMALSTVSNCASDQAIARMNKSEANRHTMGLYVKLRMKPDVAEQIYNAVGGSKKAIPVRFYCGKQFLTHGQNITCGRISAIVSLPHNKLDLTVTTDGFRTKDVGWYWK